MHFIKRAAFRALAAPSSSVIRASTPASTPFAIRQQASIISAFRRYNSTGETVREKVESTVEEVKEKAQDIASQAKEAVQEKVAAWNEDAPAAARENSFSSPPRYKAEPNSTLYVGNLLFEATPEQLQEQFGQFGEVVGARIAQDPRGLSKGFGYVEFKDIASATKAIENLNNTLFEGRRMIVNYMTSNARSTSAQNPESKTLFIGNLAFEMTDADLNKLFRDVKNVIDVRVAIDRRTGQPRGFAHADFTDVASAVEAMKALQGKSVYDRALRVDYSGASSRPSGPPRGGDRDGGRPERRERREPREPRESSW